MRIDFWSDVICPWCGLTEHRLDMALARFAHGAEVEVVHRSFPLHPDLPREGITQRELSRLYGMTPADTERAIVPIELLAQREGLEPYHALDRLLGPTDLLHELFAFASERGLHTEAWRTAFRLHFGTGRSFWTLDQVVEFAAEIGLDPAETREAVASRRYRPMVEKDQAEAQGLGVNGTPFMLLDGRLALSGARDVDAIGDALQQAWSTRPPGVVADVEGAMCRPGGEVCLPHEPGPDRGSLDS
jgi:predicted DsbA family dithiol-disulfide isomerase